MKKKVTVIIFWGSLWGLTEATLGHLLHLVAVFTGVNLGWFFWFPLAYYFMLQTYRRTGSSAAVLGTATMAAGLKLMDLLAPVRLDLIFNPAASILLEALVVWAALLLWQRAAGVAKFSLAQVWGINIAWRLLYLGYVLLLPPALVRISPLADPMMLLRLLLIESLINCLVIFGYQALLGRANNKPVKTGLAYHPAVAGSVLVLAILIQRQL